MAEKRKNQAKLVEPEPDRRQIIDTPDTPQIITSVNNQVIDCNNAALDLFGFSARDDFTATPVTDHYARPSERRSIISLADSRGSVHDQPVHLLKKDGSGFTARVSVDTIRDIEGTITSYRESISHIVPVGEARKSPRKAGAEGSGLPRLIENLRESESKFRSIFETMDEGVAIHEILYSKDGAALDYRIMDVNPAFSRNTGIPAEKVRGELASAAYGTGEAPYLDRYAKVAETGDPDTFEVYFPPLGRHFRISVFCPKKGWFATVFYNITEQKHREEELALDHKKIEEQHILFSGIINSATSGIYSVDKEYRYTSFNQQHASTVRALFGTEIATGKSILECIPLEHDRNEIKKNLDRSFEGETVMDEGYIGDQALSRQYREYSFNPIRDPAGSVVGVAVITRDATKRIIAEKALRASEERYRRLTENSQDIIFRITLPDRKFEYVSPAATTLTGYTPEEFYDNPGLMQEIIHPDFCDSLQKIWDHLPKGDLPREYEYRIVHKNGEPRWFHQRNTIVRNSAGRPTAFEGIVTDITSRKTVEIALKQIEERYRIIAENTADIIWLIDPKSMRFTFISPSVYNLLGYTQEEILAIPLAQILTPEGLAYLKQAVPEVLSRIRAGDELARFRRLSLENVRKDGSIVLVEIVATIVDGTVPGTFEVLGVSRDITEQNKARDALKESEERYRSLVETTSDLVWEVDAQARYTYVSPKSMDLLGYEPGELLGKTPFSIMPPDEAERIRQEFERLAASPGPVESLINRNLRKDGSTVVMETSAVPLIAKDGTFAGFRGIDRDVTQKILAEEALRESEERYRTFIESANEAIFVIQDGVIPFVNKRGLELIGFERDYLKEHPFSDLIHPEDRPAAMSRHIRRLNGEKIDPLAETRVFDSAGNIHWLEINAVVVQWDKRPATLDFATDITERKRADDALRESERSYHGLFNTVGDAIFIVDAEGRFLNVNDGATVMYGYPREFFIGKTPADLAAGGYNDLDALNGYLKRAFCGEPQSFEFWGKRSNGEIFPQEVRVYRGAYFGKDGLIVVASDITDRKKAEAALRESEHHYHLLADNVSDVIWTAGKEMDLTYISPSITTLTGYTPEEFVRLRLEDALTPESVRRLMASRDEVVAGIATGNPDASRPHTLELEYRKKDGSAVCAEVVISLIRSEDGEPRGVIGVTRDITDRRQTEEALRNSEEYLQTIINSVQTGLVIVDPETHRIIDVNPAAEKLTGVSRDKLIGSVCHKFICPADEGNCPVTNLGQDVDNSERILLTANGPRSILKTVVPAFFSGQRYLLESFIDITDRKHAEAKVTESEEKFRLIFRNSNDAVYLFEITPSGMPGRIVDANDVALLHSGLDKDTLQKKSFLEIHSHDLSQKSRTVMMELLTKGQVRFETEVARKDGTKLPVEVSAQFAKLNQKTYVIAISRDVSRRKREERALRIANQKLQLMNIVAWHDIQNKVTGLRGYVELSKDLVTDEQMKRFIASEEEVLKVIHQQIQYTKEYQEMGVHPQEWVNISQTLRMVLSLAELGAIQMEIEVADLEIYCDPVIAKVFSHLIDNTKIHGKKATRIRISCREVGDGMMLVYEDDGVGIPDEQKKELFMRNVGTSTGFSLFFIHDLLEVSEMTIRETGIPGEGVRFEIGIPRGIYRIGPKTA